jgi:hypothetical protein
MSSLTKILELYATEILDAHYQWIDIKDVVDKQVHLSACQKADLLDVIKQTRNRLMVLLCLPSLQGIH